MARNTGNRLRVAVKRNAALPQRVDPERRDSRLTKHVAIVTQP